MRKVYGHYLLEYSSDIILVSELFDSAIGCLIQSTDTMSLLQDVLRSHTTDNLDKQLSNASISQRTPPNPDKDDSDDELVNVVCIAPLLVLSCCH
jgi:hypothetical protein